MARLRQTTSGKSSRAPVIELAVTTDAPNAAMMRAMMSTPNVGAMADSNVPTSRSRPSKRYQVARLQRSIQGVATSAATKVTRALTVANWPVTASGVPKVMPIGRNSGLRKPRLSMVVKEPVP